MSATWAWGLSSQQYVLVASHILEPMSKYDQVEFFTRDEWRTWLAANHMCSSGVLAVFFKQSSGNAKLTYEDLVEEALCFGWIDSAGRRVDDERTGLTFTPRKPGSPWSGTNKERVARLVENGSMTEEGLARIEQAKENGSWSVLDDVEALIVPQDLASALAAIPGAAEGYEAYSPSVKKSALWWVKSAKRPATRSNRIEKVAKNAATGLPPTSND